MLFPLPAGGYGTVTVDLGEGADDALANVELPDQSKAFNLVFEKEKEDKLQPWITVMAYS